MIWGGGGIGDKLNEWNDTRYYRRDPGGCSPASVTSHVMGGFAGTVVDVFFGAEYTTGIRIGSAGRLGYKQVEVTLPHRLHSRPERSRLSSIIPFEHTLTHPRV